jgi:hypothetical protein
MKGYYHQSLRLVRNRCRLSDRAHSAAEVGYTYFLACLFSYIYEDASVKDAGGSTPIFRAIENDHVDTVIMLLRNTKE